MNTPARDTAKDKIDEAVYKFLEVVDTASFGCDKAVLDVIHADKKDLVDMHIELADKNPGYKKAFNAYSKATNSPAGRELERKVHTASGGKSTFVMLRKIFSAAVAHLPTCLAISRSENKIEQIFRDNYKPKM